MADLTIISEHSEAIIMLHGLARTPGSMAKAGRFFSQYGYWVVNAGYPSRNQPIERLALDCIPKVVAQCQAQHCRKIHFFTHSLGGILVRYYLSIAKIDHLGRVVMLAPPNQGSELADKLGSLTLYQFINGPAGLQLGTDHYSVPNRLGPVNFDAAVIAGNRSVNPLLSLLLPGENDGKVTVRRAKTAGINDFQVKPYSHTFIMQRQEVIRSALHFIQHGRLRAE